MSVAWVARRQWQAVARNKHRRVFRYSPRPIRCLGVVVGVHAVRLEGATRRVVAGAPGRDWPDITLRTIDSDRHLLRALVDCDEDAGARGCREHCAKQGAK